MVTTYCYLHTCHISQIFALQALHATIIVRVHSSRKEGSGTSCDLALDKVQNIVIEGKPLLLPAFEVWFTLEPISISIKNEIKGA